MNRHLPKFTVCPPEGDPYVISFADLVDPESDSIKVTLGRLENNHIYFSDPHKNLSRLHCDFSFEGHQWIIRDYSANGTYIQRAEEGEEIEVRCHDYVVLKEGDIIKILAWLDKNDQPHFWKLTFSDPGVTNPNSRFQAKPQYEYHLREQEIWRFTRDSKEIVELTKKQRLLFNYMAHRNHEEGQSVLCPYDELIEAVWGNPFGHQPNEINRLIWEIRKKIELDPGESEILCNEHGQGYRLYIKIRTE